MHEYRHVYATAGTYQLRQLIGQEQGCPAGTVQRTYTITVTGPEERDDKQVCIPKAERSVSAWGTRKFGLIKKKTERVVTTKLTVTKCAKEAAIGWDYTCSYRYTVTEHKPKVKNERIFGLPKNKTHSSECITSNFNISHKFVWPTRGLPDECANLKIIYRASFNEKTKKWSVFKSGGRVKFKEGFACTFVP